MDIGGTKGSRPSTINTDDTQGKENSQKVDATPQIPKGRSKTPKSILKERNTSVTPSQRPRVNTKAREHAELEAKTKTLQAKFNKLSEQQLVLDHIDTVKEQAKSPVPSPSEFSIVYIDESGQETTVIPPDDQLNNTPELKASLTNALLDEVEGIDNYYTPERRTELSKDLLDASSQLLTLNKELVSQNLAPAPFPSAPVRVQCDLENLTTQLKVALPTQDEVYDQARQGENIATPKKQVSFSDKAPDVRHFTSENALAPQPKGKFVITLPETTMPASTEAPPEPTIPPPSYTPLGQPKDPAFTETEPLQSGKRALSPPQKTAPTQKKAKLDMNDPSQQWLAFYRDGNTKIKGQKWTLNAIRKLNDQKMESEHHYIQLLFPIRTQSLVNINAPLMTDRIAHEIQSDPELRYKTLESLDQMLRFWGLKREENQFTVVEGQTSSHAFWCLDNGDHNQKRVTRVLYFLGECGYGDMAKNLENTLRTHRAKLKVEANHHWLDAVKAIPSAPQD